MPAFLKRIPRGVLACKVAFIAVCAVYALDGRHPPATAQSPVPSSEAYGLEVRSAIQTTRLDALENRVAEMRAAQSEQWKDVKANTNGISEIQGETRGIAGLLILLQIGSMVFASRKTRVTA